ncbi:hypothetical protein V6N12_054045 [Hibiscus sabdariffa]|uniref:Uncharacterized protein n=1 Tax=Hibiscus sabdariffa TaxID=183260 RepID=A0ABR2D9D3_9ROSI
MKIRDASLCLLILLYTISAVSANSVHGCGGFLEASSSVIKWRKETGAKLDYSQINVELRTADGLVKERTQCAPNGYYFIPGSFVIKISGPEGWSGDPDKVPVVIDDNGCNNNEDINFRFTGFTLSGRIVGAVGGQSCSVKNGGPANVNVDLLSPHGNLISAELTMSDGRYLFKNIIPGIVEKKSFFFYPRLHHVAVTNDGCQASIIAGDEGDIASVMKGVMLETATEADGSFVAGPLYDDITYNIKASKCNKINRFESEIIEVDLEKNSQVHVGPLKYSVEEYHHKQELTPAPVFPLIVGVSVIILFLSIPKT